MVTSGLGGIFPAGVPVGEVTENRRDPDDLLAHVSVHPRAELDRSRQLMALWFNPRNPAAPVDRKLLETLPEPSVADPVIKQPAGTDKPDAASTPTAAGAD